MRGHKIICRYRLYLLAIQTRIPASLWRAEQTSEFKEYISWRRRRNELNHYVFEPHIQSLLFLTVWEFHSVIYVSWLKAWWVWSIYLLSNLHQHERVGSFHSCWPCLTPSVMELHKETNTTFLLINLPRRNANHNKGTFIFTNLIVANNPTNLWLDNYPQWI